MTETVFYAFVSTDPADPTDLTVSRLCLLFRHFEITLPVLRRTEWSFFQSAVRPYKQRGIHPLRNTGIKEQPWQK